MLGNKNIARDFGLFSIFWLLVYLLGTFFDKKAVKSQENANWIYDPHLFTRRALMVNDDTYFRINITRIAQTYPYADIELKRTVKYASFINIPPRNVFKFSDYKVRYEFDYYKRIGELIKSCDVRYTDENLPVPTKTLIGFPPIKLELEKQNDKEIMYFSLLFGIRDLGDGKREPLYNRIEVNHLYVTGRENEVYIHFMSPKKRNGSYYMCFDVYKIESPNDLTWLDIGGFLQPFSVNYKAYNFSKHEREHNSKKN